MGNQPGGMRPPGGGAGKKDGEEKKPKKNKFEPKPASRVGRKRRKRGTAFSTKVPKGRRSHGVAARQTLAEEQRAAKLAQKRADDAILKKKAAARTGVRG